MSYRDNHIASRFYLAEWAGDDGRLRVVEPPDSRSEPKRPEKVATRPHFWGRDVRVRRETETILGKIESDAARALRQLAQNWPPARGNDEWRAIALLLAIHLWRNPYAQRHLDGIQRGVLARRLPGYRSRWAGEEVDLFLKHVTSDAYRADVVLRNLPTGAALLGSMHWTLVEFNDHLLATSDKPLTVVPILRPEETAPLRPIPKGPMLECEEIRFAVGPSRALLLTWFDGAADGARVRGDDSIAAQLNRAVIRQADSQWFHHPARRPTTIVPPLLETERCSAIGRSLLPGYGWEAATRSRLRMQTASTVERAVEEDRLDRIRFVDVPREVA